MSDEHTRRVPCTGVISTKVKIRRQTTWKDRPCGALSEPGVAHCTVHLTHLERDWLKRQREEVERRNSEASVKDATYGG